VTSNVGIKYASDFALIDSVRRTKRTQDAFRSAAIAAE